MKEFLKNVGVKNLKELFLTQGRLKFAINLMYVSCFDKVRGTNFGGRQYQNEIGTTKNRANDYSATPCYLVKTLKELYITKEDTILDLGSGKGMAMYYMSKFPFKKIGGIELSRTLVDDAKCNLKKLCPHDKKRFRLAQGDARNLRDTMITIFLYLQFLSKRSCEGSY